jgi:hypothetical protein
VTTKRQKTGGRTKGTPDKITAEFRETVRRLLEDNKENFGKWLAQVANGTLDKEGKPLVGADPAKALDLIVKLAEFAAPKLGRVEHTGADGGAVETVTRIILEAG